MNTTISPNFIIKPYDPIDEGIDLFRRFNEQPEERQHTEDELTKLVVHRIRQHVAATSKA